MNLWWTSAVSQPCAVFDYQLTTTAWLRPIMHMYRRRRRSPLSPARYTGNTALSITVHHNWTRQAPTRSVQPTKLPSRSGLYFVDHFNYYM